MKLSILDQSPVSTNQTTKQALEKSLSIAKAGDELGYTRYWIAEHHDLAGLACPAPEVMLGYIGANTSKIRIGSGATLLPHYKPYKIAEIFHTLATLFPDRIDIGIGRAPGGSAEATNALSNHYLQQTFKFPELIKELLQFLDDDFQPDNEFATLSAQPLPDIAPIPWLLGTSEKSAILAAELGIAYTFGQFMSSKDGAEIIKQYRSSFRPRKEGDLPQAILTVSVVCAETTEKAEEIALSWLIWSLMKDKPNQEQRIPSLEETKQYKLTDTELAKLEKLKNNMIIGNPKEVGRKIVSLQAQYEVDEIMILTITYDPKDRIESYKLIAEQLLL